MSERLIKTPIRYYVDNIMERVKKEENMRLLTKKKKNEALKRMLANAIIARDAVMKFNDIDKKSDACYHISNNLAEAAYAIGGKDAMIAIGKAYVDYINKKDKK